MTVNAVDCTGLSPAQIVSLLKYGVQFVGRYLSHSAWKGLNVGEVANIKAAGLQIFSIYESNPTSASYFSVARGKSDALDAISLAKAVGQPEGTAIYFTVDYDAQVKDFTSILAYFQAVKANLHGYKVGAYGSYTVLNYLHQYLVADYWFQTVAWSDGLRCSFLNIYQFQCDKVLGGVSVDFDNLETSDIGAWGAVITPAATTPATPAQPSNQIGKVIIREHTVVRKGPGASFDIVETVEKGDVYNVYAQNQGWLNVGAGWVSDNEVYFESIPLKLMGTCTVTAQTSAVRKGPDASFAVVETVNKGGVYNVYDDIKGWYNIGAGWISDNEVTFAKQ